MHPIVPWIDVFIYIDDPCIHSTTHWKQATLDTGTHVIVQDNITLSYLEQNVIDKLCPALHRAMTYPLQVHLVGGTIGSHSISTLSG